MSGLRVIWPDAKPSEEVMKTVEDLRQKGNFTEEELERLKLYLTSVEYCTCGHGRHNTNSREQFAIFRRRVLPVHTRQLRCH